MKYVTDSGTQARNGDAASRILRYLWNGAVAFVLTVVICVILQPGDLRTHYGLSFYGNFSRTLIPYGMGLLTAAYFLLRACRELRVRGLVSGLCGSLQWIAVALVGIVVTPSFSNVWLVQELHVMFGLAIFVMQVVLSVRYLLQLQHDRVAWILVAAQLLAIVLVVLSSRVVNVLSLMLPAQLLAIGSFGILLIRSVGYYVRLSVA